MPKPIKIVIIGNSGSGKTWLATRLSERSGTTAVHLDQIFWEDGGFDKKRAPEEMEKLISESTRTPSWIVEGVFGDLAFRYLDPSVWLIWIDTEWNICKRRLEARGSDSKRHMDRLQSEAGLARLIEWAAAYYTRDGDCSRNGHLTLFNEFAGRKNRLQSSTDADQLLELSGPLSHL